MMFDIQISLLDIVLIVLGVISLLWSFYFTHYTVKKSRYEHRRKMDEVMGSASRAIRRETKFREEEDGTQSPASSR